MATIQTALALQGNVTAPLIIMNQSLYLMMNNFKAVEDASKRAMNTDAMEKSREALDGIETTVSGIEKNISDANKEQQKLNNSMEGGGSAGGGFFKKISSMAVVAVDWFGKSTSLSDELANSNVRLSLIVDDGESVEELQDKIYASAQRSKADYLETMQNVSAARSLAGNAFSSNDEAIQFVESLNKNLAVSGASDQEQSSGVSQIIQGLDSGGIDSDEYSSILAAAPSLTQSIEDYMRASGMEGTMEDWVAQGLLTTEVIQAALISSADDVEKRFGLLPMMWGNIWSGLTNQAVKAFQPIFAKINEIANDAQFQSFVTGMIGALYFVGVVAAAVFGTMIQIGSFLYDNWCWIGPLMWGVIAAMLAYNAVSLVSNAITLVSNLIKKTKNAATAFENDLIGDITEATWGNVVAQYGLNAALLACPLTWVIIAIIAIIAVIYAAVAAINHFTGSSISATGIICGSFMVILAVIGNIFVSLGSLVADVFAAIWNIIVDVVNFLGNAFTDPIGAVCRLFYGLADTVLGILEALASAIDRIFGSNLAASVQGWRDGLGGFVDDTFGKGVEFMTKVNADKFKPERFDYGETFDKGEQFGIGIDQKIGGMFDFSGTENPLLNDINDKIPDDLERGNTLNNIYGNTGEIADSVDIAEEDLKYMRDIAQRDAINRFTTAEIKVDMTNHNSINSAMDLDGVIDYLGAGVNEAMEKAAEGVHQ